MIPDPPDAPITYIEFPAHVEPAIMLVALAMMILLILALLELMVLLERKR